MPARRVDAVLKALRECQRKLQHLKSGDELTENARRAFSELADAVEAALKDHRVLPDRRSQDRSTPDRRQARDENT